MVNAQSYLVGQAYLQESYPYKNSLGQLITNAVASVLTLTSGAQQSFSSTPPTDDTEVKALQLLMLGEIFAILFAPDNIPSYPGITVSIGYGEIDLGVGVG